MANIGESAMASGFRSLLAGFFAVLLLAQAAPARSEMIDLTCATTDGPARSMRFQLDTDRKSVVGTWDGGSSQYVITAISDQYIRYSESDRRDNFTEGVFDRLAGTLLSNDTNAKGFIFSSSRWACRRATQKF